MIERLQELLVKPIGYALCFSVVIFIFILINFFCKNNKRIGYIEAYSQFFEKIIIEGMIVSFIITADFVFDYMLGVRDTNGNTLFIHIVLGTSLLYIFFLEYLFITYKRVFFNDKEIIVKKFMRKTKTYYWKDITKVVNRHKDKITVTTINGKFTVDNDFINVEKFVKTLEEKKIKVENKSLLGR